jgi:microcin C transport system permease protein
MMSKLYQLKGDRRWKAFKSQKRAVVAAILFFVICLFSFTAELWSNSEPIAMKINDRWYFPVFKEYSPSEFGITDDVVIDYHEFTPPAGSTVIWPLDHWGPFETNKNVDTYPSPPTHSNYFGTDDRGRDIFSRLLYGFRYSIGYAVTVWFLTTIMSIVFGGLMGYFGGWVDMIGQRTVEVINTIPIFFLIIILVSIFEPSMLMLIILTSLFSWIGLSYYVRGEFLKNRKSDYVEAARSVGAGHLRLIFKHILPNSLVPVITFSPFIVASHILGLASLDYLGFGLRAPTPSWGELLNQAEKNFTVAWWLAVFPSAALLITLVLLALLGDGVRTAFDPKK